MEMDLQKMSIVMIRNLIFTWSPRSRNDGIDQDCDGSDLVISTDNDGDGFTEDEDWMTTIQISIQRR